MGWIFLSLKSPKLLKSLSRSMIPKGGMGRKKKKSSFSDSSLEFKRLLEHARRKQHLTHGSLHQSPCSSGKHRKQRWWWWLLTQVLYSELQTISLLHVCPWAAQVKLLLTFHTLTWFLQLQCVEYFKIWSIPLKSTLDPSKQSLVWNHTRDNTATINSRAYNLLQRRLAL